MSSDLTGGDQFRIQTTLRRTAAGRRHVSTIKYCLHLNHHSQMCRHLNLMEQVQTAVLSTGPYCHLPEIHCPIADQTALMTTAMQAALLNMLGAGIDVWVPSM